ncbi:hypothetical protein V7x_36980 [Crateriforma conspicua]|uniref:Uncharacterized protein n=1 Tax=Crateriforma conspicua TaxID=2527996 RepID=A0A5C6FJ83_9PLAN|nr:hypothetical protein V7x_36980 [Crateriforma conspicua]
MPDIAASQQLPSVINGGFEIVELQLTEVTHVSAVFR